MDLYFSRCSTKPYNVGTQKNRLGDTSRHGSGSDIFESSCDGSSNDYDASTHIQTAGAVDTECVEEDSRDKQLKSSVGNDNDTIADPTQDTAVYSDTDRDETVFSASNVEGSVCNQVDVLGNEVGNNTGEIASSSCLENKVISFRSFISNLKVIKEVSNDTLGSDTTVLGVGNVNKPDLEIVSKSGQAEIAINKADIDESDNIGAKMLVGNVHTDGSGVYVKEIEIKNIERDVNEEMSIETGESKAKGVESKKDINVREVEKDSSMEVNVGEGRQDSNIRNTDSVKDIDVNDELMLKISDSNAKGVQVVRETVITMDVEGTTDANIEGKTTINTDNDSANNADVNDEMTIVNSASDGASNVTVDTDIVEFEGEMGKQGSPTRGVLFKEDIVDEKQKLVDVGRKTGIENRNTDEIGGNMAGNVMDVSEAGSGKAEEIGIEKIWLKKQKLNSEVSLKEAGSDLKTGNETKSPKTVHVSSTPKTTREKIKKTPKSESIKLRTCKTCKRVIRSKMDLFEHLTVHSGDRRFKCYKCKNRFRYRADFNKHFKSCGPETAEVIHCCYKCGKLLKVVSQFYEHFTGCEGTDNESIDNADKSEGKMKGTVKGSNADKSEVKMRGTVNASIDNAGKSTGKKRSTVNESMDDAGKSKGKTRSTMNKSMDDAGKSKVTKSPVNESKDNAGKPEVKTRSTVKESIDNADEPVILMETAEDSPMEKFACSLCNDVFVSEQKLAEHKPLHTMERRFRCDKCGWCFKYQRSLNLHTERQMCHKRQPENKGSQYIEQNVTTRSDSTSVDNSLEGELIPKSEPSVADHSAVEKISFSCEKCGRRFKFQVQKNFHLRKCKEGSEITDKGNETKNVAKSRRIGRGREKTPVEKRTCKCCNKVWDKPSVMKAHMNSKAFQSKWQMTTDSKVIAGPSQTSDKIIKPRPVPAVACGECGKKFQSKFNLALHKAKHKTEHVAKTIQKSSILEKKNQAKKSSVEERTCKICGKKYEFPYLLKLHMKRKHPRYDKKQA